MVTVTEIKEKAIVFVQGKDWKLISIGILILVIIGGYFFWPKPPAPVNSTAIMNEAKKAVEEQYKPILEQKNTDIKTKQQERDDYKSRLIVSEAKYKTLTKKYIELKEVVVNVTPPKTEKELRDRFDALQLPPAPSGVCGPGYICFSTK
jgi:hypothetical protein